MMTKTMIKVIAPVLAVVALSGCARNIEGGTYSAGSVGEASFTYQGVIVSARKVTVEGHEELQDNVLGMALGGAGGALVGNQIGSGRGNTAATIVGGLAGATAGAFAEKALKQQDGMEYAVKLTNGSMMTVVQGMSGAMSPGQRVLVMVSQDGRSRVVPDQSGYQDVQPMLSTPTKKKIVEVRGPRY